MQDLWKTDERVRVLRETLSAIQKTWQPPNSEQEKTFRIRRLSPREVWRLMGWKDDQIDKALAVVSNAQAYKQAGNGIVIDCLTAIFKNLF